MRLDGSALKQEALDGLAISLGLDIGCFHKDMQTVCPKQVRANHEQLSQLGVSGTPALYINGVYYGGPRTVDGLTKAVDLELSKVDKALAQGATLESYYASVIAKGKAAL